MVKEVKDPQILASNAKTDEKNEGKPAVPALLSLPLLPQPWSVELILGQHNQAPAQSSRRVGKTLWLPCSNSPMEDLRPVLRHTPKHMQDSSGPIESVFTVYPSHRCKGREQGDLPASATVNSQLNTSLSHTHTHTQKKPPNSSHHLLAAGLLLLPFPSKNCLL